MAGGTTPARCRAVRHFLLCRPLNRETRHLPYTAAMDFIAQHGLALTYLAIPPVTVVALVVNALCIVRTANLDTLDL
jgi:hypothetical protein